MVGKSVACAGLRRGLWATTARRFLFVRDGLDLAGQCRPGSNGKEQAFVRILGCDVDRTQGAPVRGGEFEPRPESASGRPESMDVPPGPGED